ncbi:MAG TPA: glucuronate isomerase [Rhodanobacteraceae bacterium]
MPVPTPRLELDPDRLFPVDVRVRAVARELYALVAGKPILSPHGHVDPRLLLDDAAFTDPAELLIRHDHYVTRVLHAAGVPLQELGIPPLDGSAALPPPREVWRTFCAHWHWFAGTASAYWLRDTLAGVLGVDEMPSAASADRLFDAIQQKLREPGFRPRALFDRFNIEVLATTDDPLSDLSAHAALAADPAFRGRVVPTFRPDAYLDPAADGWAQRVAALAAWHGTPAGSYRGYIEALAARRHYFILHGAVSADHGVRTPRTLELDAQDAAKLFARALAGTLDAAGQQAFAAHMLFEMARMSVADGLVMTLHPGVYRNHSSATTRAFGPDMGNDIPLSTEYVVALRPLLERFGSRPDFHLVLFTVDETSFSRELAPLAGFYPSVYIGAPWWFLDAPDSIQRFRAAVTETAGFYRSSGFIDDTRAFLSIPARHDMARRADAAFLARLVCEGRLARSLAERIAVDMVDAQPRKVFKL